MYTKEYDETVESWEILDPDGLFICYVRSPMHADALLTHLNRGQYAGS